MIFFLYAIHHERNLISINSGVQDIESIFVNSLQFPQEKLGSIKDYIIKIVDIL